MGQTWMTPALGAGATIAVPADAGLVPCADDPLANRNDQARLSAWSVGARRS